MPLPTDPAAYLRECGMPPDTHPQLWINTGICHGNNTYPTLLDGGGWVDEKNIAWCCFFDLGLDDPSPTPERAIEYACAIERVIVPEIMRRGWSILAERGHCCEINIYDAALVEIAGVYTGPHHIALLTAFWQACKEAK